MLLHQSLEHFHNSQILSAIKSLENIGLSKVGLEESSVITYVDIGVINEHVKCRQNFDNGLNWRRGILVAAQINHNPERKTNRSN